MTDTELAIRGRSVILRSKRIEDVEDDYRWRIDDELAELDATSPIRVSLQEFTRILQDELRHSMPWVRRYGIDTHDGLHIGNCMFYDIDTASGEGELGIMVGDRDYWGKGYGTDAMAHLVEECFKMPSMRRLYLHTLAWNARARKAFPKCGFREVREVRRSGRDFVLMEVTREEWDQLRPSLLDVTPGVG
jgi:RimJ/RimL family protein N-acetyltransferase